ncbi:MAG: uracil-DNA glycosylase [Polyangiaceae bacterium]|nr:uracil-DNA glycosylase [Polyangiaceae bacterium]
MSVPSDDPREELRALTQALRAHAEWQAVTGATGLPAATPELDAERRPPDPGPVVPSLAPELGAPAPASEPRRQPSAAAVALPAPVTDPAERKRQLELIASEVRECVACGLHSARTQTVFARGTGSAGLCFVGEGPGADEDAQGEPFVGAAGQLLDKMIEAMGLSRDEVYVANIVKCRPPKNRKPEPDEMAQCLPYLERQLAILSPEVIVALGATAVQGLLGTSEGITRLRGKWKLYKGRIAVMPTFHPAYLLRTPSAKREVWADLQAVLRQMGRQPPPPKKA